MPDKKEIVSATVRLLLRPIARLCIRHSLKHQEIVEMLKGVLVQTAREELQLSEGEEHGPSISRISLATGVHRKDVTRLERTSLEYRHPENVISKVMAQWQCDPRFTTKAGKPRLLSAHGQESEFAQLVKSVTGGNLNSYSVLFEMERAGILEKKGQNVKLLGRDLIHSEDVQAGLSVMAADANDLVAAVEKNLFENPNISHLHLRTEFDKIPLKDIERAREWILQEGSRFHKRVRKFLSSLDLDTIQGGNPRVEAKESVPLRTIESGAVSVGRVSVGTFSFDQILRPMSPLERDAQRKGGHQ
jgi:hypothetical protein